MTHPSLGGHLESEPPLGMEVSLLVMGDRGSGPLHPSSSVSMEVDSSGAKHNPLCWVLYLVPSNPERREKETSLLDWPITSPVGRQGEGLRQQWE